MKGSHTKVALLTKAARNSGQWLLQAVHDDLRQARSDLMALEGELGESATAQATAQAQLRDCQDMLEELQQYATGLQGKGQATAARLEVGEGWHTVHPGLLKQLQHAGQVQATPPAWSQVWGGVEVWLHAAV